MILVAPKLLASGSYKALNKSIAAFYKPYRKFYIKSGVVTAGIL